jgi:acyl carrier protein
MTSAPTAVDKEDLRATVANVLDIEVSELEDDAGFVDDLEVDSLMALEVVVVLEKKYGIRLPQTELGRITTLQQAYELLTEKLRTA